MDEAAARVTSIDARLGKVTDRLLELEKGMARLEDRPEQLGRRLDTVDSTVSRLEERTAGFADRLDRIEESASARHETVLVEISRLDALRTAKIVGYVTTEGEATTEGADAPPRPPGAPEPAPRELPRALTAASPSPSPRQHGDWSVGRCVRARRLWRVGLHRF